MITVDLQSAPIYATVSSQSQQASVSGGPVSYSLVGPQAGVTASSGPQAVTQISQFISMPAKPQGYAWVLTTKPTGTYSISVRTSTGYAAILWWDGSTQIVGGGSSSLSYTATRSAPTSGNYGGSAPKAISIWSCGASTTSYGTGWITGLSVTNVEARILSVSGCSMLTSLDCSGNLIESLDLQGCDSLTSLSCYTNRLKTLDLSQCPRLVELYCQSNLLADLNLQALQSLATLQCNSCLLTSLDLSKNASLSSLFCFSNRLSYLDLSANPLVRSVNCSSNSLAGIRATGLAISGGAGANLISNQLSAAALNQFYGDLAPVPSGSIYVANNPGTAADSPSIASQKGYVVYGS